MNSPNSGIETLKELQRSCSNWGRWGDDDQIGALNLVGPEQVRAAAALIEAGRVVPLTLPYDQNGPQTGGFRSNPQLLTTATGVDHVAGRQDPLPAGFGPANGFGYADDVLVMPTQCGTQWDAFAHIFFEGRMWNGYSAAEVDSYGAHRNGIEKLTGRIVMRGVLVDMPAFRGVDSLQPGEAVHAADLDDYLEARGIQIMPGDALLVRTGFMSARRESWGDYAGGSAPGLSLDTAQWLYEKEVAAVATDTWGVEVRPNEIDAYQPLHLVALVYTGIAFGEMFDLDGLAADCAADDRYEFMFVASPLPLTGATGSPVSALAIK